MFGWGSCGYLMNFQGRTKIEFQQKQYSLKINGILKLKNINQSMGACAIGKQKHYAQNCDKEFLCIKEKLTESQLRSLSMIYSDLASRDQNKTLNVENFQLFFHKNGFWGERLFRQFSPDQQGHICEKEFIKGIVKIFKTSQQQKIKLLYHFFQKQDQLGISFQDFIIVLYNYPKADLKQIFNDQQFVDTQIRKGLVEICKGKHDKDGNEISEKTQYRIQGSENEIEVGLPSAYGFKGIVEELRKKQAEQDKTSLNLKIDGKDIQIKTSNIQHLVKKFARKLFKQYNINQKTGKLSYQDFKKWIMGHKNLYTNYYGGFHPQIWQQDYAQNKPRYLTTQVQKQSTGKMAIKDVLQIVHMYLLDSTIIICKQSDTLHPIMIVCLDGLEVKRCFDKNKGFGIDITHRDGLYQNKTIYLKNEQTASQWMELLKFFKGVSAQHQYQMGQKIGTGKFSIVYACKQRKTNKQYAMKIIQNKQLDPQAKGLIIHQSSIMSVLNHPLFIFYKQSIQTKTHLYIITELVKGKDLFEYVREYGAIKEEMAAKVVRQLILGVKHLHDVGIVHRDLKPENIMLVLDRNKKQAESVKIIDFGFSHYRASLDSLQPAQLLAGTPNYIAPEVLKSQPISQKIDNFAIGSIIYFMLSASLPFNGHNIKEMLQKTLDGVYSYEKKVWKNVSNEAKDLIDKLLCSDPNQRITLQDALKHQWFIKTHKK